MSKATVDVINILVAVDFSDVTQRLLDVAGRFGKAFRASLFLVHVVPPDPDVLGYGLGPKAVRDQVATQWHEEHRKLQALAEELKKEGLDVMPLLIQGPTARKLLEESARIRTDLMIMGSHGHGALRHMLVGSVSEEVLRKASCPVVVIPSKR